MPFKGRLPADAVARILARAVRRLVPGARIRILPFADGGEGTAAAIAAGLGGRWRRQRVTGPVRRPVSARWLWIPSRKLAVLDAAEACGLFLVPAARRSPVGATSRGLGEWVLHAARSGAREIWIGLGGTATVDGGIGALSALGVRFLDAHGNPVGEGGEALSRIRRIDAASARRRLKGAGIRLLCDVRSPLLGKKGAARMFGPQKGATPDQVCRLEEGLANLAREIARESGRRIGRLPGAGAAGGISAGFHGIFGAEARITSGARHVARILDLSGGIRRAELVVTGEGCLDAQTLQGKGVAEICRAARRAGRLVVAVVGENRLSAVAARCLGLSAVFEGKAGPRRAAAWVASRVRSGKGWA